MSRRQRPWAILLLYFAGGLLGSVWPVEVVFGVGRHFLDHPLPENTLFLNVL